MGDGVPARLVNINFLNDPHSPTDHEEWQKQLNKVKAELGISGSGISYTADISPKARAEANYLSKHVKAILLSSWRD